MNQGIINSELAFERRGRRFVENPTLPDPQPARVRALRQILLGITSSDGPGPRIGLVDGVKRTFYDDVTRGVPFAKDLTR